MNCSSNRYQGLVLMRLRLVGWNCGPGMREVHAMLAGKIGRREFSEVTLVEFHGSRIADLLNFLLDTLALQCGSNLIAYIVQFALALRFEPVNRVPRFVGESV